MEKRIFSKDEIDESLIHEIVRRNFNRYRIKEQTVGNFRSIVIRRSPLIACSVIYIDALETNEKGVIITPTPIDPPSIHYLFFIIYLFTGGLAFLFGYFVHKFFQISFRNKVSDVIESYLQYPQIETPSNQVIFIMK